MLDVGCGPGYFARLLAEAVGPEGRVVGIDPSPEMIAYASRKAGHASNCQFRVGTAESLDLPAEQFDVVVSSLVMHHLPEDLRVPALREMRRVLRPGATLLVAEAQMPRHGFGWRLLADAGSIDARGRRGTFVVEARRPFSPRRYRRVTEGPGRFPLDLSTGTPDPDLLPDLGPALARVAGRTPTTSYLDDPVVPALEEALRAQWPFAPEALTVVDGAMDVSPERVGIDDMAELLGLEEQLELGEAHGVLRFCRDLLAAAIGLFRVRTLGAPSSVLELWFGARGRQGSLP